jgi:hypothetical protein
MDFVPDVPTADTRIAALCGTIRSGADPGHLAMWRLQLQGVLPTTRQFEKPSTENTLIGFDKPLQASSPSGSIIASPSISLATGSVMQQSGVLPEEAARGERDQALGRSQPTGHSPTPGIRPLPHSMNLVDAPSGAAARAADKNDLDDGTRRSGGMVSSKQTASLSRRRAFTCRSRGASSGKCIPPTGACSATLLVS